jgi:hypothetical protein
MSRNTIRFALVLMIFAVSGIAAGERILIVHDELPQMKFLAELLEKRCGDDVTVKTQAEMPEDLSPYKSVIVYIHGKLFEKPELAFIAYTKAGGRLIVLHHSISSGKRANKYWFDFLGIKLPEGDWEKGGYRWIEPVAQKVVNVSPFHYIASHDVEYEGRVLFSSDRVDPDAFDCFTLKKESEVYLNHAFTDGKEKTLLLGFIYKGEDVKRRTIMQSTSGWLKKVGKGWLIYLQPGHSLEDMGSEPFQQILINALRWKPKEK